MATRPTAIPAAEPPQPAAGVQIHRLDLAAYNRIVDSGALEGQRAELLGGVITEMSPQSPQHALLVMRLTHHFAREIARLRVQLPLEVPPNSEPEPDIAVIDQPPTANSHPRTALLVVEIALSSHATDRGIKAALYARAAIPVYWLVDVPARALEVRTRPGANGYERLEVHRESALVPCPLDGVPDLDLGALLAGIGH